LLGNVHEISNYTMAVTTQQSVNSKRGIIFSVLHAEMLKERPVGGFSCDKLEAQAGDSLGTQSTGNICHYQAMASEYYNRLKRPSMPYSDL
jgi:hypothetical protein